MGVFYICNYSEYLESNITFICHFKVLSFTNALAMLRFNTTKVNPYISVKHLSQASTKGGVFFFKISCWIPDVEWRHSGIGARRNMLKVNLLRNIFVIY